jgi:hypothetical protein
LLNIAIGAIGVEPHFPVENPGSTPVYGIPLWTLNAKIPIGDTLLQLLWIPDTTYDDIPGTGASYEFTSPLVVPQVPTGVPVLIEPLHKPDDFIGDSDVGSRISMLIGGWGLSLNYAYHYFYRPVTRREVTPTCISIQQNYERTHLVGGSLSNVIAENRGRTAIIINRGWNPGYRMTEPFTINCAMLYYRRIIRFDPFPGKIL